MQADDQLDLAGIESLLRRVEDHVHSSPNRVRYSMNGFVISVGGYVLPLQKRAKDAAKKIGKVHVDVGPTDCKVPSAVEYIDKMIARGNTGKKRKTMKC